MASISKKTPMSKRMGAADYLIYAFFIIFSFIAIYPFFYTIVGSFNEGRDFAKGGVWLYPRQFTFSNYVVILEDETFWLAFRNTILITVIGTLTALAFTSFVAYCMSRKQLRHRKLFHTINLITMFFGGGLIPYYIVILILGLYDNFMVYIIPSLYSVYNMLILQNFFKGIPEEIHESALMDGASEFTIWWKLYMPMSKPVLATVALWIATGHWNSYFKTMVYTKSDKLITLQYYLVKLIKSTSIDSSIDPSIAETITSQSISYAAVVIATIPILFVYPFLQRFFTKGIALGSLKE